ncbi:S8 family peptidase [Tenacibaculum sp. IB213877]|uniref:S8 family peptidase n=1 Tax=Tenacibaculum sp. IB213877 TaxID=3097351 RepID=UPI002A59FD85|nr:S8 family serine peptidase [Tenacibaculum sp. IB213877]MDY0780109.1 S8 family serine peptidase [Tenacibaculum sp. IB213877]
MKKVILSFTVVGMMFSCSNNEEITVQEQQQELLSRKEINAKIKHSVETTGDFRWTNTDVHTIWSAVKHGDEILTIGYGTSKNDFERSEKSQNIKEELIKLVDEIEGRNNASRGTKELYVNEKINVIDMQVASKETIETLLKDPRVRYIEPAGYSVFEGNDQLQAKSDSSSSSGCGYSSSSLTSSDYRTVSPGARVPWSFDAHNIPAAWSYSTGQGVTVAVVDTGLSPEQKWMNQYFNDGYSSGRSVQKYGTFVDSWWSWSDNYDGVNDKCGHGTSMASVATAPRNNDNLPVGVAYNANLVTYRAVENVVVDDYHEKRGIDEALTALGDRSDVKVISMSIGSPFSIGRVEDAVKYAYNRGKMIIAAGGTSTSFTTWYGVIFPAWMNETVAVTGVKEGQYSKCDVCHTGSEIEFTVQMQRTNGTDNKVPVLSYYDQASDYVGGSSVATATTAGIAALVWSKHPTWTREQVLQKMRQSADFYPNKHSEYGYGNINVLQAVQ